MLPGVLPGVTWCYLECYLGVAWRYLGFYFRVVFFYGPKISAFLKLKLLGKDQFHLEMLPGPTPVVVTCLPGPPSEQQARVPIVQNGHFKGESIDIGHNIVRRNSHILCTRRARTLRFNASAVLRVYQMTRNGTSRETHNPVILGSRYNSFLVWVFTAETAGCAIS